jgi:uncharacterized protein YecT (DUF1311 family)
MAFRTILICILALALDFAAQPGHAQLSKPTMNEIASIRHCATKHEDNLDQGERRCLFNLIAQPCIDKGSHATITEVYCYETETSIWDGLLNDNYQRLLETLDSDQTAKAQAMQRAWIAYRDTTCGFYDDKIQGTMSQTMHAACITRETARRAMLLKFFSRL